MNHLECNHRSLKREKEVEDNKTPKIMFCLDHKIEFCKCGTEFGSHDLSHKFKIKNRCVLCMTLLELSKERFILRGNFCSRCAINPPSEVSRQLNIEKYGDRVITLEVDPDTEDIFA